MGIIDKMKGGKPSVVGGSTYQWEDKGEDVIWKIPKNIVWNDNIVVKEDEYAIFFRDGKALTVFDRPGRYALTTQNIMTWKLADKFQDLTGIRQIGEIYYLQRREMRGKFGTKEPIAFRDSDFGMVRIRVFGQYSYKVKDPLLFITQFIGTESKETTGQIVDWFRDQIVMSLNDILGELKRDKNMAIIDVPAYLEEMEQILLARIKDDTERYGVEISKITGLNFNLPEKVQEAIDKRGELQALGVNYMQYQAGQAMVKAAENEGAGGNMAGMGVGLGAGLGMGYGMTGAVGAGMDPNAQNPWGSQQPGVAAGKKCPKCGTDVPATAKFCNICGENLSGEKLCIKCGQPVAQGTKFCSNCGSKQTMECPSCKQELSSGAKFCPNCGFKMG
ncbi:MAG: SPFH domain-containing protein [Candidatus Thermoplasmatota archaeon]|nr:SPFH domain-containing protein [Candidatus Thermoplasmatota archaeon]